MDIENEKNPPTEFSVHAFLASVLRQFVAIIRTMKTADSLSGAKAHAPDTSQRGEHTARRGKVRNRERDREYRSNDQYPTSRPNSQDRQQSTGGNFRKDPSREGSRGAQAALDAQAQKYNKSLKRLFDKMSEDDANRLLGDIPELKAK